MPLHSINYEWYNSKQNNNLNKNVCKQTQGFKNYSDYIYNCCQTAKDEVTNTNGKQNACDINISEMLSNQFFSWQGPVLCAKRDKKPWPPKLPLKSTPHHYLLSYSCII